MEALGYYNGAYGPLDEMTVPMTDRAVYYGDGVYEATPTRNKVIYALDAHVNRMLRSASLLRIDMPMDTEALKAELKRMVALVDGGDNVLYWQLSRGTARRAHPFPEGTKANLMMMITPYRFPDLTQYVKCITLEDTRFLHCNIKTLNLIPSIMAMQTAKEQGCYEAILHRGGRVTECSKSNVHILKDGRLITAPADNLILSGIARAHLLEACAALGIPAEERPYTVKELMRADEILITSSTSFLRRAVSVDGQDAGAKDPENFEALKSYVWTRFLRETSV
ncbi:MAG: aminotransferase class IV [Clostridia bacterium]|jgi:D-alanine transaminase|nr:aminotransferase class IV [Clostridia bacterium]MBR5379242.1 aminotransferase class IV [Clostridia bacterium]MBR5752666.1 aminotransferase class IV [Clostridia bacterium]